MRAARWSLGIVAGKLLLHLLCAARYDFHRDEIYLLICGHHLQWGSPDHAPLAPALARVSEMLFGGSPVGMHVMAALLSAATLAWTVRLCRRLGGDDTASAAAAAAVLIAPVFLFYGGVYCTGTLDALCWIACCDLWLTATLRGKQRDWLLFGAALGIGVLCKYTAALCGLGLATGLLLSAERRQLLRSGPWLALLLVLVIALPNFIWQSTHGAPALAFFSSSYAAVVRRFDRLSVLAVQPLLLHPFTFVITICGLRSALQTRGIERTFAGLFIVTAAVVVLTPGKPYYLAPAYLPLIAVGARTVAAWLLRRSAAARTGLVAGCFFGGVLAFILTLPVLPKELLLRLKIHLLSREMVQFADWRGVVRAIAAAHQAAGGSERLTVLTDSYGSAAAIEHYGAALGLPRPLSGANSYFLWGPSEVSDSLLVIGYSEQILAALCQQRTAVGAVSSPNAEDNRYDFPRTIWLCRGLRTPLATFWPRLRRYD